MVMMFRIPYQQTYEKSRLTFRAAWFFSTFAAGKPYTTSSRPTPPGSEGSKGKMVERCDIMDLPILMLVRVHPENPGERQLKIILECLQNGGVIIYPTDTVYALGCDIRQVRAIERVARIKGVKMEKANFSLICSSLSHLSDYSRPISNHLYKIMRKVLPGPYTFILNASNNVPRIFQSKKKTVGIRNPDHKVPLRIVELLGNPLLTTSVHQADDFLEYPTDPEEIHEKFKQTVDIVIDSGPGGIIPSTVVDCTGDEPLILRQGLGDPQLLF